MGKVLTMKVEGFGLLERNLLKLKSATTGKPLDKATEEAAIVMEELEVALVPVDMGRLRSSITRARHKKTLERSEWDVGPDSGGFYGLFQENGTIFHAAQPFMRPAFDEGKAEAQRSFRRTLLRAIRRLLIRGK